MAQYRDVELNDGRTVRVYRPPYSRIHANVAKRFPEPLPPVITATNVTGREIPGPPLVDDPTYREEHARWEETRNEAVDQMGSLFMFKDLEVPDGWDVEAVAGAEMRYFDPDWAPREGVIGRKLDYIQWDILADDENAMRVIRAVGEMTGIDVQEVEANLASFRSEVAGETD